MVLGGSPSSTRSSTGEVGVMGPDKYDKKHLMEVEQQVALARQAIAALRNMLHAVGPRPNSEYARALHQAMNTLGCLAVWGDGTFQELNSVHTDFGHTLKSMWFVMMAGSWLERHDLIEWGHA